MLHLTFVKRDKESPTTTKTYPTGLDGCVICPSAAAVCPKCPSGQVCNQLTRTCSTCPEFVCVKGDGAVPGSKPIGAIVGGVVGGVGGLAVIAMVCFFLYYKLIYRKKNPRNSSIELDDEAEGSEAKYQDSESSYDRGGSKAPRSRRLSSYESFMRPPRYNKRGQGSAAGSGSQLYEERSSGARGLNQDVSKRNSMATTVSTSNASNILPIAYIPGVTIRPTKNNTRSIYLYEAESINSEAPDTSLVLQHLIVSLGNMMTAVKAQPKLINVARIEEDEEPEDSEDDSTNVNGSADGADEPGPVDPFAGLPKQELHRLDTLVETDGESDSDVDSDIGEIRRANSTRRHANQLEGDEQYDEDAEDTGSFIIPIMRE
ncbi:hypothetical protein PUMCH_001678 [Australozyma saopauloensis]|uniref:Membrane anchor Opy2 N-terminal domain-containing protein n=1 Tax=Australozyma saopauloensis TaxID=291208 RepID=A0AAX4H9Q3_9ASCO|nr:hypothetical protein PUMCH_001678 [[Candida] saopauloensis]